MENKRVTFSAPPPPPLISYLIHSGGKQSIIVFLFLIIFGQHNNLNKGIHLLSVLVSLAAVFSIVTQRYTKNGCEGDYVSAGYEPLFEGFLNIHVMSDPEGNT